MTKRGGFGTVPSLASVQAVDHARRWGSDIIASVLDTNRRKEMAAIGIGIPELALIAVVMLVFGLIAGTIWHFRGGRFRSGMSFGLLGPVAILLATLLKPTPRQLR